MIMVKPLYLCVASAVLFLQTEGVQASAPVYRQITLPDGMSVPNFGCETPYTGEARGIVRTSGEPGQARVLLNVDLGSAGYGCNPRSYPENKLWAGIILDQSTNRYTLLSDSGEQRYKAAMLYAADANISYPVGFAYNEELSGHNTKGSPVLWEQDSRGEYQSRYLPLPKGINPEYIVIPLSVSDDGLTVTGSVYQINYSDEDYSRAGFALSNEAERNYFLSELKEKSGSKFNVDEEAPGNKKLYRLPGHLLAQDGKGSKLIKNPAHHLRQVTAVKAARANPHSQVIWTRSQPGSDFKADWVTDPLLSAAVTQLVDTSANISMLLYNGQNSEGADSSFLARFNGTSGNITSVETYGRTTTSYLLDNSGSSVILKTPLENEDYLIETAVKNFTSGYATRFTSNGLPQNLLGELVAPYTDVDAFVCYSSYPFEGFMTSPGDSGIRISASLEIENAFNYLKNYCNVKEMQSWNSDNWHFLYLGQKKDSTYTYYGYYSGKEDVLFEVSVDQAECKKPAR